MARITVEDCLEKVENQYDLVLLAKERTVQLNAGEAMLVDEDNDKRTIISLREIGDGKISVQELEKNAVKRLRKEPDEDEQQEDTEEETNDDFESLYKGQISKSGVAILPSKRTRRVPDVKKAESSNLAKEAFENMELEGGFQGVEDFLQNQYDIRLENLLSAKKCSIHHLESSMKNKVIQRKQLVFENITK